MPQAFSIFFKMAANARADSDSLLNIPDDISVKYLPNVGSLSDKVLQKGLNYFTQGYIHDIKINDDNYVQVDARCWRSMRKSQEPHKLHIEIKDNKLSESYCTCKVGLNGHCSHIVGLLKSLQGFKLHNFTSVPDQQSCTSIPQQWHIPRGKKIVPVPINHVVVAKPIETRKRKPVVCHFDVTQRLPKVSSSDIRALKSLEGTPLEYTISESHPTVNTPMGDVQIGSLLSYHTRNIKEVCPVESEGCGNTSVHRLSPVDLPQEYEFLNQSCDPKEIERGTRNQADSQLWMKERRNRLTASNFGKVLQRKSTPNEKFLSNIFRPKNVVAESLEYGKRNEENAKAKYLKQHPSRHFHKCGLVINEKFTFLGASPDGKLCDDGVCGIVEIKCPFSARNFTICQSLDAIQNFCLEKNNDGTIQLKRSHQYYMQIQGQLMITGCEFCEFIVFTQKDLFVERILPDVTFMNAMLVKLASFFKNHAKPFLDRNSS